MNADMIAGAILLAIAACMLLAGIVGAVRGVR